MVETLQMMTTIGALIIFAIFAVGTPILSWITRRREIKVGLREKKKFDWNQELKEIGAVVLVSIIFIFGFLVVALIIGTPAYFILDHFGVQLK